MGATLTIDGLTMEASGLWGISGRPSSESLIVREADIKVTGLNGAVCDFPGGITIEGCTIDTPAGGEVQNGNIVDKDGNVAMTVELKTPPFDLYVCNKQVTKGNCEDILGDGAFSYDNDTKTLTVTGNATAEGSDYVIYNEGIDGLTIDVAADVTLEAQKACIGLGTNTTLKGKGTLKITSTSDCAIYAYRGATLTIDGLTIEASGLWGISGRPTSESLIVRRANIKATGLNGAVCDFPSGIMLENCTIETPEGGKVQDGNIVDEDGNVSLTVELKADEVVGVGEVESERVKSEKYPSTGGLRGTFDLSGRPVNHQSANRKLVVRDGKVRSE